MSRALGVFHGRFGRATLYQLNRPFNRHAHREGHLIFHVSGAPAFIDVSGRRFLADETSVLAVNPWEPHNFVPNDLDGGAVYFVLYVDAAWFAPTNGGGRPLRFGSTRLARTGRLDRDVRSTAAMAQGTPALGGLDRELRSLIRSCYEESWRTNEHTDIAARSLGLVDFRVRKSIRLIDERIGKPIEFDAIAREAGLSRPHFYKLFRTQTGVTPHLYANTLLMERSLRALVETGSPVSDIGFDLGFSSQSGFTRFFAGNVGMPPTEYRRAAKVLHG